MGENEAREALRYAEEVIARRDAPDNLFNTPQFLAGLSPEDLKVAQQIRTLPDPSKRRSYMARFVGAFVRKGREQFGNAGTNLAANPEQFRGNPPSPQQAPLTALETAQRVGEVVAPTAANIGTQLALNAALPGAGIPAKMAIDLAGAGAQGLTETLFGVPPSEAAKNSAISGVSGAATTGIANAPIGGWTGTVAKPLVGGAVGAGAALAAGADPLVAAASGLLNALGTRWMASQNDYRLLDNPAVWDKLRKMGVSDEMIEFGRRSSDPRFQQAIVMTAGENLANPKIVEPAKRFIKEWEAAARNAALQETGSTIIPAQAMRAPAAGQRIAAATTNIGEEAVQNVEAGVQRGIGTAMPSSVHPSAVFPRLEEIGAQMVAPSIPDQQKMWTQVLQAFKGRMEALAPKFQRMEQELLQAAPLNPDEIQALEQTVQPIVERLSAGLGDASKQSAASLLARFMGLIDPSVGTAHTPQNLLRIFQGLGARERELLQGAPNRAEARAALNKVRDEIENLISNRVPAGVRDEWELARRGWRQLMDQRRSLEKAAEVGSGQRLLPDKAQGGYKLAPQQAGAAPMTPAVQARLKQARVPATAVSNIFQDLGVAVPPDLGPNPFQNLAARLIPRKGPASVARFQEIRQLYDALSQPNVDPDLANGALSYAANELWRRAKGDVKRFNEIVYQAVTDGWLPANSPIVNAASSLAPLQTQAVDAQNLLAIAKSVRTSGNLDKMFRATENNLREHNPIYWQEMVSRIAAQSPEDAGILRAAFLGHLMRGNEETVDITRFAERFLGGDKDSGISVATIRSILGSGLYEKMKTLAEAARKMEFDGRMLAETLASRRPELERQAIRGAAGTAGAVNLVAQAAPGTRRLLQPSTFAWLLMRPGYMADYLVAGKSPAIDTVVDTLTKLSRSVSTRSKLSGQREEEERAP